MFRQLKVTSSVRVMLCLLLLMAGGCAINDAGGSGSNSLTQLPTVGTYPEPSRAIAMADRKPMLVVAPLAVEVDHAEADLGEQSAAVLYNLLEKTGRFDLSPRESFAAHVDSATTAAADAAQRAEAVGADFVAVGRVTQLTVHPETRENWLRNTWGRVTGEAFDPTNAASVVRVTVAAEVQIIHAATAQHRESQAGTFNNTAPAEVFDLELEGYADPDAPERLAISADSERQLVRYALDDALRRMLPNLDQMVLAWIFEHDF